jgi:PAS domain S-box-containing protein
VQHSSDLIVVVDQRGVLVYANPAASRMFGLELEDAIGKSAFGYLHPEDVGRVVVRFAELVEQPGTWVADTIRFVSAAGEVHVLETVSTNCLDRDAIAGIVVNGRDVTERNRYVTKLEASFDAITIAIAHMVELRDPYTAGHQRDVAEIATAIARELALPEDEVKGIGVASTIHDIGKIAIPAEILTRPGKLTAAEFEIVKSHSQAGHDIVADVPFPWPVAEMILQHHERLDGSGYPNALRGSAILPGSLILGVADVVSAMSEHRPYRPALGLEVALGEIESKRDQLYDADVVDACLRLYREGQLRLTPFEPTASGVP